MLGSRSVAFPTKPYKGHRCREEDDFTRAPARALQAAVKRHGSDNSCAIAIVAAPVTFFSLYGQLSANVLFVVHGWLIHGAFRDTLGFHEVCDRSLCPISLLL